MSFMFFCLKSPGFFKEICEVYLALLLIGGGLLLQQRREVNGLSQQPLGFLHHLVPGGIGLPVGVGVREEDNPAPPEREQLDGCQFVESAGSQTDIRDTPR